MRLRVRLAFLLLLLLGLSSCGEEPAPASCEPGTIGCGCTGAGTCLVPEDGSGAACVRRMCQSCEVGTEGCSCGEGGACLAALACEAGSCLFPADGPRIPATPRCYTPCSSGLVGPDGLERACSPEGLMEGCVDGASCVEGSCVPAGGARPVCADDRACPDFQTCITGSCYSTCEADSDCGAGHGCDRKVCRRRCGTDRVACGRASSCVTEDGATGFCRNVTGPSGLPRREVRGSFLVRRAGASSGTGGGLGFSNIHTSDSFEIVNLGRSWAEFTVEKLLHREFRDDGPFEETTTALPWLTLGTPGALAKVQKLTVKVDGNGGMVTVALGEAHNPTLDRWEGTLRVSNPELGGRDVQLSYLGTPDGQWAGRVHSFGNFPDEGLTAWALDKTSAAALGNVGNALIHRWVAFKRGDISFDEFSAVVQSTSSESWKWPSMKKSCPQDGVACYPYDNPQGYSTYSASVLQWPIPSAVSSLPFAMNLRSDLAGIKPAELVGKIVSARTLQYAGDPAVTLEFEQAPSSCTASPSGSVICPLKRFEASIYVGGRYLTSSGDTACSDAAAGTFLLTRTPWLIPGLVAGTEEDPATGLRFRHECRDKLLPFGDAPGVAAANQSFATSNPIPDGRTRKRRLELVDGALVDSKQLVILFKETFDSFLGESDAAGFSSYGLMVLERAVVDLDAQAWTGAEPKDERAPPVGLLGVSCTPDLLGQATGTTTLPTSPSGLSGLARTLVEGLTPGAAAEEITPASNAKVHYFCQDTGLFNAGKDDTGTGTADGGQTRARIACPVGSLVEYFTVDLSQEQVAALPCQSAYQAGADGGFSPGSCRTELNAWRANGLHGFSTELVWVCADSNQAYCETHRTDLRAGKKFFRSSGAGAAFNSLRTDVADAFRYKTRFRNRQGKSIGFSPSICLPQSDAIPYCYDPPAIEAARDRVDCAVALYTQHFNSLDSGARSALKSYLTANFSFEQTVDPSLPLPVVHDGFERLFAELLIMQGDEAYTSAFASRFDLAGASLLSFEGAAFESGGINLSGGAGYEMYTLYQAAQYYQAALDRFYALSPLIWDSIDSLGADDGFVNKDTVATYFDRLIRASSQKARAWSEVAKRYQGFNRPDLARRVIERSYTSTYLESIVLSRLMLKLGAIVLPEDRPQLVERLNFAQLTYRSALLAMRDGYSAVTDNPTQFGFAPDYIPFPAQDVGNEAQGNTNAFETVIVLAKAKQELAAAKEELALSSSRAYETDTAVFQSELVSIRNNYENRLAEVCGTFSADDGRVYPAIPKYAYLDGKLALLGNPCGLVGNGELTGAMAQAELAALDLKSVGLEHDNLVRSVAIQLDLVNSQCNEILKVADYRLGSNIAKNTLDYAIRTSGAIAAQAKRAYDFFEKAKSASVCLVIAGTANGSDCPDALVTAASVSAMGVVVETVCAIQELAASQAQSAVDAIETNAAYWETKQQCDYARVESDAEVKQIALGFKINELEGIKALYRLKQAMGEVERLRNEATRVFAEQQETEQHTINIEAARNDPNVRIYKNDAVIAADRTFQQALREAYRATKVFEYYTSQTYGHLGDLYLVRMVSHGDVSLESYLGALEEAFWSFEEQYGNPDLRVAVVSLRDDVLAIPRLGQGGRPLSEEERLGLFRAQLTDVARLDARGYLTLPFRTELSELSPLTSNHKVRYVQAEFVGADVGDALGRVYLTPRGTGVVRALEGGKMYFGFPERTAVVNPFFNGEKVFDEAVYTNVRLRDRPLVNTRWDLVLNQKDEAANKDIDLNSLTDVRLYLGYNDFTHL